MMALLSTDKRLNYLNKAQKTVKRIELPSTSMRNEIIILQDASNNLTDIKLGLQTISEFDSQ